jgi:hypothetical protein
MAALFEFVLLTPHDCLILADPVALSTKLKTFLIFGQHGIRKYQAGGVKSDGESKRVDNYLPAIIIIFI